jgi:TATA-box binding protein (TBP) (component of TFIID and TFIIIB)
MSRRGFRGVRGVVPDSDEFVEDILDEMPLDADHIDLERVDPVRLEECVKMHELRTQLGFTIPTRFDVVDLTPRADNAWIFDARYAELEFSESASVHRHFRSAVDFRLEPNGPIPMGSGRVFEVPNRLSDLRFPPRSMYCTPQLLEANMVATFGISHTIDLNELAHRVVACGYNSRRFAALSLRISNARTALFFSRGSVVCTGSKGTLLAISACLEFVTILHRICLKPTEFCDYGLRNVVNNAGVGFRVNLTKLAERYRMNAQYKPTRFPGLVFRLNCRQRVFIVFACQVIETGFKNRFEALIWWRWFHAHVLWEFRLAKDDDGDTDAENRRKVANDTQVVNETCQRIAAIYEREMPRISSTDADLLSVDIADKITLDLLSPPTQTTTSPLDVEREVVRGWFAPEAE